MNSTTKKVLAIGLDAAAPAFVRQLIEEGQLPNLQTLLSKGRWMRVQSTAYIGSGSVWPTFITGHDATKHGVYGEWVWQPQQMDVTRYSGNSLPPFWKDFQKQGITVGILDLPFMPMVGLSEGFEVSEWGPHDVVEGKTVTSPPSVDGILAAHSPYPTAFSTSVSGPDDYHNLQKLAAACVKGARLRGTLAQSLIHETNPDFCLIVFPETHRAGHYFWHTVEPDDPTYGMNGFGSLPTNAPSLRDIYQEIDRQIGELLKRFPQGSEVLVFSMHGMRPSHGVPTFLEAVLTEAGFSSLTEWAHQNWRDRARTVIANIKRLMPAPLKSLYYSIVPATTAQKVARSTLLPQYDWSRTRAFALPTDQHGWIRINLVGRESQGIVPLEEYEITCDEIEKLVAQLRSEDGKALVRTILRTTVGNKNALTQTLPDLIIHWENAVFASPLKVNGLTTTPHNIGMKYVGQHSLEGFCIMSNDACCQRDDVLAAKEMGALITNLLRGGVSSVLPGETKTIHERAKLQD